MMEQTHPPQRWTDVLKHRWPTVLGIAVAALAVFDLQGGTELAALTMLMPEWRFWSSSPRARRSSLR
jgi:hypothetical protein